MNLETIKVIYSPIFSSLLHTARIFLARKIDVVIIVTNTQSEKLAWWLTFGHSTRRQIVPQFFIVGFYGYGEGDRRVTIYDETE